MAVTAEWAFESVDWVDEGEVRPARPSRRQVARRAALIVLLSGVFVGAAVWFETLDMGEVSRVSWNQQGIKAPKERMARESRAELCRRHGCPVEGGG